MDSGCRQAILLVRCVFSFPPAFMTSTWKMAGCPFPGNLVLGSFMSHLHSWWGSVPPNQPGVHGGFVGQRRFLHSHCECPGHCSWSRCFFCRRCLVVCGEGPRCTPCPQMTLCMSRASTRLLAWSRFEVVFRMWIRQAWLVQEHHCTLNTSSHHPMATLKSKDDSRAESGRECRFMTDVKSRRPGGCIHLGTNPNRKRAIPIG